jgi:hypothetical protein
MDQRETEERGGEIGWSEEEGRGWRKAIVYSRRAAGGRAAREVELRAQGLSRAPREDALRDGHAESRGVFAEQAKLTRDGLVAPQGRSYFCRGNEP